MTSTNLKSQIIKVGELDVCTNPVTYADRIREVEQASFTPLVFVTTGGMGREAVVFY